MSFGEGGDATRRKKKIAIITISSLILVVMVVAVAIGFTTGDRGESEGASTAVKKSKAVYNVCQSADYKETCINTLSSASGDKTDPLDLIKVGFNEGIRYLREAMKNSTKLKELTQDDMTRQYLEGCIGHLDSAINEFNASLQLMDKFDITKLEDNIHNMGIWLSGAYSFQTACLDQFESSESKSEASQKMKNFLSTTKELAVNSLAIVTDLSSVLTATGDGLRDKDDKDKKDDKDDKDKKDDKDDKDKKDDKDDKDDKEKKIPNRRLLFKESSDGFPSWVDGGRRKLLTAPVKADVVVALDGSGKFKTIGEALKTVPPNNAKPYVIHIKEGVYKEYVEVTAQMTNVVFVGDGPTKTKITGDKSFADNVAMELTRTVHITGNSFTAKDIGFENTAPHEKKQAVALRVESDRSIFYNCQIDGNQDTLYLQNNAQFFRDCTILGTVDFIFGYGAVVFQNCKIVVKKPPHGVKPVICAHGRMKSHELTGLVFHNCNFMGDPQYLTVRATFPTYLSRPWKPHSRLVIMQSEIDDILVPEGFLPWGTNQNTDTCYFAEFNNRGPGADTSKRVNWKGIKKNFTPHIAAKYTVETFLRGEEWIKPSGVPFIPGMVKQN